MKTEADEKGVGPLGRPFRRAGSIRRMLIRARARPIVRRRPHNHGQVGRLRVRRSSPPPRGARRGARIRAGAGAPVSLSSRQYRRPATQSPLPRRRLA